MLNKRNKIIHVRKFTIGRFALTKPSHVITNNIEAIRKMMELVCPLAAVGDTVNVASHLESLCRSLESEIAMSDALIKRALDAGDAPIVEGLVAIGPQQLKDRSDLVRVWIPAPSA